MILISLCVFFASIRIKDKKLISMNKRDEQKNICKKYNSDFTPLNEDAKIAVALSTVGSQPIYGSRIDDDDEVEWYIYCGEFEERDDFYEPISLNHLKEILPQVEQYLALDRGFNFIIDNKGYEDVWHESETL